jgi:hypothetical protein
MLGATFDRVSGSTSHMALLAMLQVVREELAIPGSVYTAADLCQFLNTRNVKESYQGDAVGAWWGKS